MAIGLLSLTAAANGAFSLSQSARLGGVEHSLN